MNDRENPPTTSYFFPPGTAAIMRSAEIGEWDKWDEYETKSHAEIAVTLYNDLDLDEVEETLTERRIPFDVEVTQEGLGVLSARKVRYDNEGSSITLTIKAADAVTVQEACDWVRRGIPQDEIVSRLGGDKRWFRTQGICLMPPEQHEEALRYAKRFSREAPLEADAIRGHVRVIMKSYGDEHEVTSSPHFLLDLTKEDIAQMEKAAVNAGRINALDIGMATGVTGGSIAEDSPLADVIDAAFCETVFVAADQKIGFDAAFSVRARVRITPGSGCGPYLTVEAYDKTADIALSSQTLDFATLKLGLAIVEKGNSTWIQGSPDPDPPAPTSILGAPGI